MGEPNDLAQASRDELLAVIAAQQATIAEQTATIATLQARIAALERRLGSSGGKGVPGTKPTQRSKATGQPRKRRAGGYARLRMTPTAVVRHAAARCPDCGTRLAGGWV